MLTDEEAKVVEHLVAIRELEYEYDEAILRGDAQRAADARAARVKGGGRSGADEDDRRE